MSWQCWYVASDTCRQPGIPLDSMRLAVLTLHITSRDRVCCKKSELAWKQTNQATSIHANSLGALGRSSTLTRIGQQACSHSRVSKQAEARHALPDHTRAARTAVDADPHLQTQHRWRAVNSLLTEPQWSGSVRGTQQAFDPNLPKMMSRTQQERSTARRTVCVRSCKYTRLNYQPLGSL
jgi:hypothetical protein